MKAIYEKPQVFTDAITTYCGGCGHGIVGKLIAELIDELDLRENGILVWPIGCSCLSKFVLCYQGDGDMVSEGMAEIMHAAIRSEKFTVIFINNAIYGMTGGQMAPTTLEGQYASTAPAGRKVVNSGYPVHMAEIMGMMPGVCYSERVTITSPGAVAKCKNALKKGFQNQLDGKGLSFIEILSPCPTGWKMAPLKAMEWVDEVVSKEYPLGLIKDTTKEEN